MSTEAAHPAGQGLGGVWALKLGFARDKIAVVDQVFACLFLMHLPCQSTSLLYSDAH